MDLHFSPLLGAIIIFAIRVLSIAVSTLRLLMMGRSNAVLVSFLAFLEALSFALTFGIVARDLTNIYNLVSYSGGFAAGTWVGMWIEERVGMGYATIHIVSRNRSHQIVERIRAAGHGATHTAGEGSTGAVGMIWLVTRRRSIAEITRIANETDETAFVAVSETRSVQRGFMLGYGRV